MPQTSLHNSFHRCGHAYRKIDALYGIGRNSRERLLQAITDATSNQPEGVDPTSCNANSTIVGYALNSGLPMAPVVTENSLINNCKNDPRLLATLVKEELRYGNPLLFTLIPNHYFWVVPVDEWKVQLLQGFLGWYDLHEWLSQKRSQYHNTGDFLLDLVALVSRNAHRRGEVAVKLFAIDKTRNGSSSEGAENCSQWMREYFEGHDDTQVLSVTTVKVNRWITGKPHLRIPTA